MGDLERHVWIRSRTSIRPSHFWSGVAYTCSRSRFHMRYTALSCIRPHGQMESCRWDTSYRFRVHPGFTFAPHLILYSLRMSLHNCKNPHPSPLILPRVPAFPWSNSGEESRRPGILGRASDHWWTWSLLGQKGGKRCRMGKELRHPAEFPCSTSISIPSRWSAFLQYPDRGIISSIHLFPNLPDRSGWGTTLCTHGTG